MRWLNRLSIAPRLRYTLPRMAMKPVRLISWVVLLSLIALIGAQTLAPPTSHSTASDASRIGKHPAHDPALIGFARVGTGEKARKALPLVTTCAPGVCTRLDLAPPLIERAGTAVPHRHALPIYQRISVYRI